MEITYLGQKFEAPPWVSFVAADNSGYVYGYEFKPELRGTVYINAGGMSKFLGTMPTEYPLLTVGECQ